VRTRDSERKVELGFSSGQMWTPDGSSPLKSFFLAATPWDVGAIQERASALIVLPCVKNPHLLQKISPLRIQRWWLGWVWRLPMWIGVIISGMW